MRWGWIRLSKEPRREGGPGPHGVEGHQRRLPSEVAMHTQRAEVWGPRETQRPRLQREAVRIAVWEERTSVGKG